ncbi:hypothetical protein OC835_002247 [Tilletia horrida]|nr:hypothetical protein OC835_002247 [Tilletia horrida]
MPRPTATKGRASSSSGGGGGGRRARDKATKVEDKVAPSSSASTSAALELPDFMHEDDEDADPGANGDSIDDRESRYDASYNAFMDELDRDDDDDDDAQDADESAAATHSLSVLSTSLIPNRSTAQDGDEEDEDDNFDLFAPRRATTAQQQAQAEDVRDAEDPMYAQRLADILGSDDGDDDEEEEEAPSALNGLTPSPSALEDARDAARVEQELSVDLRDTTVETGMASTSMEEDDDEEEEEEEEAGFVYMPSKQDAEEEDEDEDEDGEGFVYAPSKTEPGQQGEGQDDDDDEDEDEDDEEEGFVYRPNSAPVLDAAPQLPPLSMDSSTPPAPKPIPLPPLPAPAEHTTKPKKAAPAAQDRAPKIFLTAVDPELSLDLGMNGGAADEEEDDKTPSGSANASATASIASLLLPRRKPLPSLKIRPKLLTPSGSMRSFVGLAGGGGGGSPSANLLFPFPPPSATFGPGGAEPGSASYATFPVASSSSTTVTERDILRLSSLRKIGAKLYPGGGGGGGGAATDNGALANAAGVAQAKGLGAPTVLAAGEGLIAVGTTRGWTLIFALDQELRCVVGTEALAQQGGSVTALSFSLDSTFIGIGHASGHIALFDLSKPSIPARQVAPVSLRSVQAGRKEGHLPGCAIVQLGFVARRHTAIISADAAGVAVYHALGKILGVSSNDTLRIFGQYPAPEAGSKGKTSALVGDHQGANGVANGHVGSDTASVNGMDLTQPPSLPTRASSSKSILFGVQPLPLGSTPHLADGYQFVAILTPHKLVLVGLKPSPRTWWRKTAPARREQDGSAARGRMGQWSASNGRNGQLPEDEDFAEGLEVGDGLGGLNGGASTLRLVRGIPEGRTADDFVTWKSSGDGGPSDGAAGHEDEEAEEESGALCGAMAWLPASEMSTTGAASSASTQEAASSVSQHVHPILAFSFGRDLLFLHLVKGRRQIRRAAPESNGRGSNTSVDSSITYEDHLGLQEEMALLHKRAITGLQWLSPDLLLILDAEGLNLFDLRIRRCTERQRLLDFRAIPQRWDNEGVFHPVRQGKSSPAASAIQALTASHSFKVHEGRAFLLGSKDLLAGTALSWTDRILTLVSSGDFLAAIELAQRFYEGKAPGSVIGLPSDRAEQKRIVGRKLRDLMAASASYAFSPARLTDSTHVTPDGRGVDRTPLFEGMARVCALACLALDDLGFLFGDLYELYAENGIEGIFVGQMEEFIVSGRMRTLPTDVVQRLVAFRKASGDYALAERIIYHVDPLCLDLDQSIGLCLEQRLYDALIYVYTEAMDDFTGPLVELIELMKRVLYPPSVEGSEDGTSSSILNSSGGGPNGTQGKTAEQDTSDAYTLFAYLSAGLTGYAYPSHKPYPPERALQAKRALYGFVFAGACVMWPQGKGGRLVLSLPEDATEPTYPYLRLLLHFDADALLEVLEAAFEDSFLNDDDDEDEEGARGKAARVHTRQKIVDLLLHIAEEDAQARTSSGEDDDDEENDGEEHDGLALRTSISIFVARNAPKFPQFVRLAQEQVDAVFEALTTSAPDAGNHEERQLATEYLLSSYKVADGDRLLELLEQAGFWRLLQDALRRERRWDRLIEIYIGELRAELDAEDESGEQLGDDVDNVGPERPIFAQLEQILGRAIRERTSWLDELGPRITEATPTLLRADVIRTVALIERFFPARHHEALEELAGNELAQLAYLRCFYDPAYTRGYATATTTLVGDEQAAAQSQTRARIALELLSVGERLEPASRDRYIALLARHRPDDLVQAFDAQPWAEYIDLENGGRFLFDKHFGSKVLGQSAAAVADAGAGADADAGGGAEDDKEPSYREVKPFLDGMTSAYRLRIELLGMANRLFDRDLFGDLDRLAAKRVRGWRPKAAISGAGGSMSSSNCRACGEALIAPSHLVGVPTAANGPGVPSSRARPGLLRDRQRSSSMISLPPPRPPSSPFIEAAAGGPAKPDKGKGVSRGYFPPFEDAADHSPSLSLHGGLLSPGNVGGGVDESGRGSRRMRSISPHGHAQLRAMSMGGGGGGGGISFGSPGMNGGGGVLAQHRASTAPLLNTAATLSPALGLGSSTASVFAEMQASDTQPADLFAPDAAALGLPPDEDGDGQRAGEYDDAGDVQMSSGGGPGDYSAHSSWDLPNSSFRLFPVPPISAGATSNGGAGSSWRPRTRATSEDGLGAGMGLGMRERLGGGGGGSSFESGLGLLVEHEQDEALVVFASGEVRHRRCCQL